MRDARSSERSTLSSERMVCGFCECATCASISAYPALNRPTSDECFACAVAAWTSASRFARRKEAMKRFDAAAGDGAQVRVVVIADEQQVAGKCNGDVCEQVEIIGRAGRFVDNHSLDVVTVLGEGVFDREEEDRERGGEYDAIWCILCDVPV